MDEWSKKLLVQILASVGVGFGVFLILGGAPLWLRALAAVGVGVVFFPYVRLRLGGGCDDTSS